MGRAGARGSLSSLSRIAATASVPRPLEIGYKPDSYRSALKWSRIWRGWCSDPILLSPLPDPVQYAQ